MWRRVLLCFGIGRREGHESSHPRPHGPLTDRDNFFAQRNIPQGHAIGANSHVPVSNNTQGVNIGAGKAIGSCFFFSMFIFYLINFIGGGNRDVSLMDSAYLRECVLQVVMDIPRAVTEYEPLLRYFDTHAKWHKQIFFSFLWHHFYLLFLS